MERVLESLADEQPQNLRSAVKLLTVDTLASSSEQAKHKSKTKISASLKSSGSKRAYGAILARLALRDWSVVKSHGGAWAVIMSHVSDLPDHVCWKPITKTLTDLFVSVQGKPDLSRDVIGGSRIGEFVKRLLNTSPYTHFYGAATKMLQCYPTQCRPYINKSLPILRTYEAPETIASLCVSEKQSVDVWQTRVGEVLAAIEDNVNGDTNELKLSGDVKQLAWYIKISPRIHAKIPSQRILMTVSKMLISLKPAAALEACRFIEGTFHHLTALYVQSFDSLVYNLAECLDLGQKQAIAAFRVIFLLVKHLGWVSEKYASTFSRLQKRALKMLNSQRVPSGVEGLADYVQNPNAFVQSTLSATDISRLSSYLALVSVNVPGLPQSLRVQSDQAVLNYGSSSDIVRSTLYPSKYSILPSTIDKIPTLDGFEALVHPRFPPLNVSKYKITNPTVPEEDDEMDVEETPEGVEADKKDDPSNETPTAVANEIDGSVAPVQAQINISDLPKIPESNQPKRKTEFEASIESESPPEKRPKVESPAPVSDVIQETVIAAKDEGNAENEIDDDEDDFIIPVLNMDSD